MFCMLTQVQVHLHSPDVNGWKYTSFLCSPLIAHLTQWRSLQNEFGRGIPFTVKKINPGILFGLLYFLSNIYALALTGVAQLVGGCPSKQNVAGLIPGEGTCLVVGSIPGRGPQLGSPAWVHRRGNPSMFLSHINVSLPPSFPLSQ